MLNIYSLSDGFKSRIDGRSFQSWDELTAHNAELIAVDPAIAERPEYKLSYDACYAQFLPAETGVKWFRDLSCYSWVRESLIVSTDPSEDFGDPLSVLTGCEILGVTTFEPSDRRLIRSSLDPITKQRVRLPAYRRCWFVVHDDSILPFHEVAADESYVDGLSFPPRANGYGGVVVAVKPGEAFPKARESSVLGPADRVITDDMRAEALKRRREALQIWQQRTDADSVRRYLKKLRDVELARELAAAKLAAKNKNKARA